MQNFALRVGLLGLGHAASHHARALDQLSNIELGAVCDLNPARYETLGIGPGYRSLDEMLDATELDAVIVATPNADHIRSVQALFKVGQNVIVEKPAAESMADFKKMIRSSQIAERYLHVALHSAFGLEVLWLKDNLNAVIGDRPLTGFHCELDDPYIDGGVLRPGALGLGGSWIDCAVNALSVVAEFFNVETLSIADATFVHDETLLCADTAANVRFQFGENRGLIETDWRRGLDRKVTSLQFEDIEVILHHTDESVLVREGDNERVVFASESKLPRLTNHYVGVFDDIATRFPNSHNQSLALTLHQLVFAAQEKAES